MKGGQKRGGCEDDDVDVWFLTSLEARESTMIDGVEDKVYLNQAIPKNYFEHAYCTFQSDASTQDPVLFRGML